MDTYEKKYKEIVGKVRKAYLYAQTDSTKAVLKEIFPELAESNDEKIRKVLIKFFSMGAKNNLYTDGIADKDIIAWLEKQELKSNPYSGVSFNYNGNIWGMCARDNGVDISCDKHLIKHLEKQAEVKESAISQHEIETCKENNNSLTSEDEKVMKALLEMVHDTTGDELWIDYNVHKEEALDWLERQCEQKFEMKTAEESLGIDSDTYNKIVDECIFGEPKTKENNGNIGGISPNWSEEDKGIIEEVVSYLINYSNIVESKEDADRIEYLIDKIQDICPHQKQEWSEEDEQHIDSLLKRLDALCRNKFERTRFAISEDRDWLKSLKGRVQPKQEWSEEDSQYIDDAFTLIGFGLSTHTKGEVQEWLLSLKGRVKPQWKPSDEQMNNK